MLCLVKSSKYGTNLETLTQHHLLSVFFFLSFFFLTPISAKTGYLWLSSLWWSLVTVPCWAKKTSRSVCVFVYHLANILPQYVSWVWLSHECLEHSTNTTFYIYCQKKKKWITAELLDLCDKMRELRKKRFEPEGSEKYKQMNNNIKICTKKAMETG